MLSREGWQWRIKECILRKEYQNKGLSKVIPTSRMFPSKPVKTIPAGANFRSGFQGPVRPTFNTGITSLIIWLTCWVICWDCWSCSRLRLEGAETDTPTWGWPTLEGRVAVDMEWLGVSERVKRGEGLWLGVMEREMRAAADARSCCCCGLALMLDVLWGPNAKIFSSVVFHLCFSAVFHQSF